MGTLAGFAGMRSNKSTDANFVGFSYQSNLTSYSITSLDPQWRAREYGLPPRVIRLGC